MEEEKGVLVESLRSQLVALQSKYEEDARLLDKAAEEAKKYQAELEEVRELSQSELSSLQAELAAARSESNTSKMGTEAVSSLKCGCLWGGIVCQCQFQGYNAVVQGAVWLYLDHVASESSNLIGHFEVLLLHFHLRRG